MTAIYFDDDVTLEPLRGKSAGIFGYSELGQALALNLRDSGIPVFTAPESARQQAAAEMELIPVLDVG